MFRFEIIREFRIRERITDALVVLISSEIRDNSKIIELQLFYPLASLNSIKETALSYIRSAT